MEIKKALETAENALKQVYLSILINQYDNSDELLKLIHKTSIDVYGNEIIYVNEDNCNIDRKKLEIITVDLQLSEIAIKCALKNTGAFVNLLNSECEYSIKKAVAKQLNLLYEEIRKDCKVDCTDEELRYILLNNKELLKKILIEQLCEWKFLCDENNKLFKYDNKSKIYTVNLIKYYNFIIDDKAKEVIIEEAKLFN